MTQPSAGIFLLLWYLSCVYCIDQQECYCTTKENVPVFEKTDIQSDIIRIVPKFTCFYGEVDGGWFLTKDQEVSTYVLSTSDRRTLLTNRKHLPRLNTLTFSLYMHFNDVLVFGISFLWKSIYLSICRMFVYLSTHHFHSCAHGTTRWGVSTQLFKLLYLAYFCTKCWV